MSDTTTDNGLTQEYSSSMMEAAAERWEAAAEAVLAGDNTVVCDYETCLAHAAECRELAEE